MDRYALDLYGWENINLKYGYGLEFLDLEEDAKIPEELKATINKEDLFW